MILLIIRQKWNKKNERWSFSLESQLIKMDKDEVEKQNKIEITINNEIKLDLSPNIRDSNEWNIWVKKRELSLYFILIYHIKH